MHCTSMGKSRKNLVKVKNLKPQKLKGISKAKGNKKHPLVVKEKGRNDKKIRNVKKTPVKSILFVSPSTKNANDRDNSKEDKPAVAEPVAKPAVLEPVPTDIPDPCLQENLQRIIKPVIAYFYNDNQVSLKRSFEEAGLLLEKEYDPAAKVFRFLVNTKEICKAIGEEAPAHGEAREKLIQIIRYYCYTVKRVKEFHTRRKIFHARPPNPPKGQPDANIIREQNIGFKMLQKQGWSGGALGTNEDGIIEPIMAQKRKGKSGLGTENATEDAADGGRSKVKIPLEAFYMVMKQYAGVNALYDLVFSTQFTKPQLAKLKNYASSLKLLPQMIGHNKRLVVSRPLTIQQIKLGVMKGHSDLCAKYIVIPPAAGIPEGDKMIMVKPKIERSSNPITQVNKS